MLETLMNDSLTALPILLWPIAAIAVLVFQLFFGTRYNKGLLVGSLVVLIGMAIFQGMSFQASAHQSLFHGSMMYSATTQFFNWIAMGLAFGLLATLVSGAFEGGARTFTAAYEQIPEIVACIFFSGFGVCVLASAIDLTALFLGLEILSISLYCLAGFYRTEIQSTESGFKYLMMGGFSTVLFLYGLAFLYGATGSTSYMTMAQEMQKIAATGVTSPFVILAIVFLVASFGFKLALVPFHLYVADVYEGAPTPVTGYLQTVMKAGAIAAALPLFWEVLEPFSAIWTSYWVALAVLSILIGNIVALQQRTLKRLLAFSSISHAGFLALGLVVAKKDAFPLFSYLIVYSAMTLGLFALLSMIEERGKPIRIEDLRGLAQKRIWVALGIGVFILGLAGIPPFAGFMIKFWIFKSLIEDGHLSVAIVGAFGSLIGAAYYLKVLMALFISEEEGASSQWKPQGDPIFSLRLVAIVTLVITLLGVVRPQIYADWLLNVVVPK